MATARLYVGNFPYHTTEADLRDLFSSVGTVKEAKVITDRETGQPKGFGFVEMESPSAAGDAIDELNGQDYNGRPLRVAEAEDRKGGSGGRRDDRGERRRR